MTTQDDRQPSSPRIVQPHEEQVLQAFGDTVQVKLTGEDTRNSFDLGFGSTPPGHVHTIIRLDSRLFSQTDVSAAPRKDNEIVRRD